MERGKILPSANNGMNGNEMIFFDLHAILVVEMKLVPCLTALQEEHMGDDAVEIYLTKICQESAWIPPGQVESWVEGLLAGIRGNWRHSLDKLLPRVEAALRHVHNKRGLGELKLGRTGGQRDLMLGDLLAPERCKNLMSDEWRNDLLATTEGRNGWNLRNNHCHGLIEDQEYNSMMACYFWWQMLHFTVSASLVPDPPLATPDNMEPAKYT